MAKTDREVPRLPWRRSTTTRNCSAPGRRLSKLMRAEAFRAKQVLGVRCGGPATALVRGSHGGGFSRLQFPGDGGGRA
jgi:hypothetical protein